MSNRTVLVDNNTWNNTHIATVGRALASSEEKAYPIMEVYTVAIIYNTFWYLGSIDIPVFFLHPFFSFVFLCFFPTFFVGVFWVRLVLSFFRFFFRRASVCFFNSCVPYGCVFFFRLICFPLRVKLLVVVFVYAITFFYICLLTWAAQANVTSYPLSVLLLSISYTNSKCYVPKTGMRW